MSMDKDIVRLKALAHPLRILIVKTLSKEKDPISIKAISSLIEEEPSKLHYHFKLLEQAGIIDVTDTRVINGITEKYYSLVEQENIDLSLKSNQDEVKTIIPVIESTALDMIRRIPNLNSDVDGPLYGTMKDFRMTLDMAQRYKEALAEFTGGKTATLPDVPEETDDGEAIDYNFMVFLVPKPKK